MSVEMFPKQRSSYLNSNKRLNIWDGSVRSGKTVGSIYRWIKYVGTAPPGDLLMCGKTNDALYRNVIRPMEELLGSEMQYNKGTRNMYLWDREIFCIGANDERAEGKIRGMTAAGGYCDEITLWPESFFKMMLSRLSVKNSKLFGSTNPDHPAHWLKRDFIDKKHELDMNVFHFDIDDNTFLDPEYVKQIKKEFTGVWYKRFILGLWVLAEGSIYDFFDEDVHCIEHTPTPKYYIASSDYNISQPFAFGLFGVNPDTLPKIWLEGLYWYDPKVEGSQRTDSEHVAAIRKWLNINYNNANPRQIYVDPSASSFKLELRRQGMYGVRDAENDVDNGLRTQARMLKNGQYAVRRCKENQPCIDEYYSYVWDERASNLRGEDKPLKQHDHSKDMERYAIYSMYGEDKLDYSILNRM